MSARIGGSILLASLAIGLVIARSAPASAQSKGAPPAPPTVSCELLEITATSGKDAAIDPELEKLKKKFKKPPFSSWNQFKLLMKAERVLSQRKAETIALKLGKATATVLGIVNKSQVRITVTIDDANGKNFVNNTSTFSGGDYLVFGHSLPNNDGHLLALTCR